MPSQQIARRIRGRMGEHRISGVKLAAAIGMDQAAFSRRYSGKTDWSVDELARVAKAFGISFAELVAVEDDQAPETPAPGGGSFFLPPGEVSGAPSGTRTPNPLVNSFRPRLTLVPAPVLELVRSAS